MPLLLLEIHKHCSESVSIVIFVNEHEGGMHVCM